MGAQADISRRGSGDAAGGSQEETRVGESAAGCVGEGLPILPGVGGLLRAESKLSVGAAHVQALNAFKQSRGADLKCVISLDPGEVGVERRLVVVRFRRERERYARIRNSRVRTAAAPAAVNRTVHAGHVGSNSCLR